MKQIRTNGGGGKSHCNDGPESDVLSTFKGRLEKVTTPSKTKVVRVNTLKEKR